MSGISLLVRRPSHWTLHIFPPRPRRSSNTGTSWVCWRHFARSPHRVQYYTTSRCWSERCWALPSWTWGNRAGIGWSSRCNFGSCRCPQLLELLVQWWRWPQLERVQWLPNWRRPGNSENLTSPASTGRNCKCPDRLKSRNLPAAYYTKSLCQSSFTLRPSILVR